MDPNLADATWIFHALIRPRATAGVPQGGRRRLSCQSQRQLVGARRPGVTNTPCNGCFRSAADPLDMTVDELSARRGRAACGPRGRCRRWVSPTPRRGCLIELEAEPAPSSRARRLASSTGMSSSAQRRGYPSGRPSVSSIAKYSRTSAGRWAKNTAAAPTSSTWRYQPGTNHCASAKGGERLLAPAPHQRVKALQLVVARLAHPVLPHRPARRQ